MVNNLILTERTAQENFYRRNISEILTITSDTKVVMIEETAKLNENYQEILHQKHNMKTKQVEINVVKYMIRLHELSIRKSTITQNALEKA